MWISKREYQSLTAQIEFWQQKATDEQARADRVVDEILAEAGRRPVSQEHATSVRASAADMKAAAAEQLKQFQEAFEEDDGSDFISEDGNITMIGAPIGVPVGR